MIDKEKQACNILLFFRNSCGAYWDFGITRSAADFWTFLAPLVDPQTSCSSWSQERYRDGRVGARLLVDASDWGSGFCWDPLLSGVQQHVVPQGRQGEQDIALRLPELRLQTDGRQQLHLRQQDYARGKKIFHGTSLRLKLVPQTFRDVVSFSCIEFGLGKKALISLKTW